MTDLKKSLTIAVRADASSMIGTGHVFRCLSVCDQLRESARIVFVCREAPGHLGDLLLSRGYELRLIPNVEDAQSDAAQTRKALAEFGPLDWLVVDHYKLDAAWERAMRAIARRVFVIDDLADRPHDADLLLDYTHAESSVYDGLAPERALRLIGPRYVLLREEFFGGPRPQRTHDRVSRLLVTLGGNDPIGMTGRVLEAVDSPEFANLLVDVTVGSSNVRIAEIRAAAERAPNVRLHVQCDYVAELMRGADLCVGAGGLTSWERCYLGLPTLIVILAENQRAFVADLDGLGAVRSLGDGEALTPLRLRDALAAAMADAEWRRRSAAIGCALVDGLGTSRVVQALLAPDPASNVAVDQEQGRMSHDSRA